MDIPLQLETWSSRQEQFRPNQWGSYKEALRAAHQRSLDTAEALKSDIERLSQRRRDRSWTRSQSRSQSRSHSRTSVNLEAIAELRAQIIARAAHGMYVPGPLMDPHPGGE